MTTTCQICGREIKAKHGIIAHHGYRRLSGWGCNTASCWGSRRPPYEQDRTELGRFIANMSEGCLRQILRLRKVRTGTLPVEGLARGTTVSPGDPFYPMRLRSEVGRISNEISHTSRVIADLVARYDAWVPPGEKS